MGKLKKCPFCGGEAYILGWKADKAFEGEDTYTIRCYKCKISIAINGTKQQAIEAWNKRTKE